MLKKVLYTILCLVMLTQNCYSGIVVGAAEVVPVESYNDITFFWTCENLTLGEGDYSAGDTTATEAGATLTTDAVKYGSYGVDSPANYDSIRFEISSNDIVSSSKSRLGFWINVVESTENSSVQLFISTNTGGDPQAGADGIGIVVSADGSLITVWDDGANDYFNDTGYNLTDNTWYFMELEWDVSTNSRKLYINGSLEYSSTSAIQSFTINYLQIGATNSQASNSYYDNIMISNLISDRNFYTDTFNGTALKDLTESPR